MSSSIEEARQNIDKINEEIVDMVDQRMGEVLRIIEYKEEHNMPVKDEEREEKVMDHFAGMFEQRDMPRERGRQLGRLLIDTAVDLEREILGTPDDEE